MRKRLFAALLALALLVLPALALEGMDVSVYQGEIDFRAARADGIEAVYIRSSFGLDGVDSRFRQNHAGATAAGLPFGFYHYLNARTVEGARAEAEHFSNLIGELSYSCRPVLDFEHNAGLSGTESTAVARAFLETVEERLGVRPMLYADGSNARILELGEYPLWVAQWEAAAPDLAGTAWQDWTGWQYTDRGRVDGIAGPVDRDRFTAGIFLEEGNATFPYAVRRGETLWGLARRFGVTVTELVRLNGIENPDLIFVGQVLRIPGRAPAAQTYTVQRGDTLWGIAQRFGTTVGRLVQANDIPNPNLIFPGQVLTLP